MVKNNNESEMVKKMKKDLKPKLYFPIWNTIICSGPPLNLIFRYFLERDIKNPTIAIILTVIAVIWIIICWYLYVKEKNDFNKNWEEISIELQDLNLDEEPSKDIIGTILDILMTTTIASLILLIIFAFIAVVTKLNFLKFFVIFSLLVFLISAGGLIIVSSIQIISLIRVLIKGGKFKKALKRFILIYTLSFIILIIISFIVNKNLQWIQVILRSLLIAFPVFLSIEVIMFSKEIKKEYSLDTTTEENDSK